MYHFLHIVVQFEIQGSTVIRNSELDFRKAKRRLLKLRFEVPNVCEQLVPSSSVVRSQTILIIN
jgi:hypothetical protein